MKVKKDVLVCSIFRNGRLIVPTGQDELMVGDSVIIVAGGGHITSIREILE